MLNPWQIFFHFLWILGAAIVLAAFSWRRFRRPQPAPWTQLALDLGALLFCLGLAGVNGVSWQGGLWLALAVALGAFAVLDARALR